MTQTMTPPTAARQRRATAPGVLLALSGLIPVIGIANPFVWPALSSSGLAAIAQVPFAFSLSLALVSVGLVCGLVGTAALSSRAPSATAAAAVCVIGVASALAAVGYAFQLGVTVPLSGVTTVEPSWYAIISGWRGADFRLAYGLFMPVALALLAAAAWRARLVPAWAAIVLLVGAAGLVAELAFARSIAPFPHFLAVIPFGIALAARRAPALEG